MGEWKGWDGLVWFGFKFGQRGEISPSSVRSSVISFVRPFTTARSTPQRSSAAAQLQRTVRFAAAAGSRGASWRPIGKSSFPPPPPHSPGWGRTPLCVVLVSGCVEGCEEGMPWCWPGRDRMMK